jgi:hypothetical protein
MSKNSVDASLNEVVIYKALNLNESIRLRHHLVMETTGCWFYIYNNSFEIKGTTEWGGKLSPEKVKELQKIVNKHSLP